eukprot:8338-Heterococcus_DN1.PRE.1
MAQRTCSTAHHERAACTRVFSKLPTLLLDRKLASVMITTRAALRNQQQKQCEKHRVDNTMQVTRCQPTSSCKSARLQCVYLNSGVRMMVAQVIDVVHTTRLQLSMNASLDISSAALCTSARLGLLRKVQQQQQQACNKHVSSLSSAACACGKH